MVVLSLGAPVNDEPPPVAFIDKIQHPALEGGRAFGVEEESDALDLKDPVPFPHLVVDRHPVARTVATLFLNQNPNRRLLGTQALKNALSLKQCPWGHFDHRTLPFIPLCHQLSQVNAWSVYDPGYTESVITKIQKGLQATGADAWLAYDFAGQNPAVLEALGLEDLHLTRRFFYLVPDHGEPALIAHTIEADHLAPRLTGEVVRYTSWSELRTALAAALEPFSRVAMTYSPGGHIPYLSRIDGGTIELIRSFGVEVVSDAMVLLQFQTWDQKAYRAHLEAALGVLAAKDAALGLLRRRLPEDPPSELELQREMLRALSERGLQTDHPPIVAFGAHAASPHYAPSEATDARLAPGEVVLLDVWAKTAGGPYADITWMAAWAPGEEVVRAFEAVKQARDRAVAYVREAYAAGRYPLGFEVDRATREVLRDHGFETAIRHRTGHHLGWRSPHGGGTHLDDLETHDTRPLIPGLAFTVEPGVYPGPFGIRSEIDVFLEASGPVVTTEVQSDLEILGSP